MTSASVARNPGANLTPAAAALTAAALGWLLLLAASPVAAGRGQLRWVAAAVYHAGSLVCHQRPERSFHLDGIQLPVCARCFGLYASGAIGLILAWTPRRKRSMRTTPSDPRHPRNPRDPRLALALAALPVAASVGLEWMGALTTTNVFRMMTAVPLGLVGGLVMIRMLRASAVDPATETAR